MLAFLYTQNRVGGKIPSTLKIIEPKNQLTIYTIDKTFTIRDTLINFQHRINRRNFLQISRHAVMNIDHLESLSDSFSGNMMAKLTRGVKSSVSRKYVKSLMDYLGV